MILQANLILPFCNIGWAQVQLTGPQGNVLADYVQQFPDFSNRGEGAEVFRPICNFSARQEHAGEGFIFQDDIGIGFVVLQVDIVFGLELFDKGILQQKSVLLGIYYGEFYPFYSLDEFIGFVAGIGFIKIRADPLPEAFGLSYIQQRSLCIIVFVYTGMGRYGRCYFLEVVSVHNGCFREWGGPR
jgi:hypothetical protein